MAEMEFGARFAEKTGKAATTAIVEGGGVALGFLGAGALGKYAENKFKPGVVKTSSATDKIVAWVANVIPKGAAYYGLKYVGPKDPRVIKDLTELALVDAKKATVASVVVDGFMRATNGGAPGVGMKLFGVDILTGEVGAPDAGRVQQLQGNIQKVIQENGQLRNQLNQALQKLASGNNIVTVTPVPPDHDRKYGMMNTPSMQTTPEGENRRKSYGSMDPFYSPEGTTRRKSYGSMESTPPAIAERDRYYGSMNKAKLNFAGENDNIASTIFGML